jgi:hypothetical protein
MATTNVPISKPPATTSISLKPAQTAHVLSNSRLTQRDADHANIHAKIDTMAAQAVSLRESLIAMGRQDDGRVLLLLATLRKISETVDSQQGDGR